MSKMNLDMNMKQDFRISRYVNKLSMIVAMLMVVLRSISSKKRQQTWSSNRLFPFYNANSRIKNPQPITNEKSDTGS